MIERSLASSGQKVRLLISDPHRPIDWLWGISHQLNPVRSNGKHVNKHTTASQISQEGLKVNLKMNYVIKSVIDQSGPCNICVHKQFT